MTDDLADVLYAVFSQGDFVADTAAGRFTAPPSSESSETARVSDVLAFLTN